MDGTDTARLGAEQEELGDSCAATRSWPSFPLYGGIAVIVCAAIVIGPGLYLIDNGKVAVGGPLAVIGYYLLALIGYYFSVGLAAAADLVFRGEEATFADGLAVSREPLLPDRRLGCALGLRRADPQRAPEPGRDLRRGPRPGAGDRLDPDHLPRRAGDRVRGNRAGRDPEALLGLFRDKWGQQVTGNIAIGGAVFLFGMLPSILLVVAGVLLWSSSGFAGALLVILGVIGFAIAALISSALSGIFGVALYRYATGGEALGPFTSEELESAVRTQRWPQSAADGDARHGLSKAFTGRRRSHSFETAHRDRRWAMNAAEIDAGEFRQGQRQDWNTASRGWREWNELIDETTQRSATGWSSWPGSRPVTGFSTSQPATANRR